ncbi:cupin domain-containing protein [Marinomonas sp. 2405UD68-3]|uniref:cupin domain-containing protein n=1 Tax=Marinomonas sp. 2405UD68-3 TaxID=3391835 RepID=UPI0039C92F89
MSLFDTEILPYSSPRKMNTIDKNGLKSLLLHSDTMKVYQEYFFQNEIQQRFYHFSTDCYLFALDGQAFIQNSTQECSVKVNQGVWLEAETIHKLVPISGRFECLLLVTEECQHDSLFTEFMRVQSTGTAIKLESNPDSTRWVLSDHPKVKIEIELLPKKHQELIHYHRFTKQFLVSLTDTIQVKNKDQESTLEPKQSVLISPKHKHSIINNNDHSAQILNFYTPRMTKDCVLVISKPNKA